MTTSVFHPQLLDFRSTEIHETTGLNSDRKDVSASLVPGASSTFEAILSQRVGSIPTKGEKTGDNSTLPVNQPTLDSTSPSTLTMPTFTGGAAALAGFTTTMGVMLNSPLQYQLNGEKASLGAGLLSEADSLSQLADETVPFANQFVSNSAPDFMAESQLSHLSSATIASIKMPFALPRTDALHKDPSSASIFIPMTSSSSIRLAYENSAAPVMEQVANEITRQVGSDAGCGTVNVHIRLDRSDVGPVNLHLSINNDLVSIRIVAQDKSAQQVLNNQLDDLRQSLINAGVTFNLCQVSCESTVDQVPEDGRPGRSNLVPDGPSSSRSARLKFASAPPVRSREYFNFVA